MKKTSVVLVFDIGTQSTRALLVSSEGKIPVSYTHLDVYKRQFYLCLIGIHLLNVLTK